MIFLILNFNFQFTPRSVRPRRACRFSSIPILSIKTTRSLPVF